jgi:hypothetical protein
MSVKCISMGYWNHVPLYMFKVNNNESLKSNDISITKNRLHKPQFFLISTIGGCNYTRLVK